MGSGDKVKRLAVDATLRAAAPYQRARRARTIADGKKERKVLLASSGALPSGCVMIAVHVGNSLLGQDQAPTQQAQCGSL